MADGYCASVDVSNEVESFFKLLNCVHIIFLYCFEKKKFCSHSHKFFFFFQDELIIKSIQVFDWRLWSSCSPSHSPSVSSKSVAEKRRGNVKFDLDIESPCDDASSCTSYSYCLFQSWYISSVIEDYISNVILYMLYFKLNWWISKTPCR